ncbi:MAG: RelA/SpoT domain-containing protein [Chloroflexi bacterium]|nr:RelA/SpoT domain-containing protein [Chloroflexota bacterium]
MMELGALRSFWIENKALYESFAKHVHERLLGGLCDAGIPCETSYRAKALDSLVKKAVRKGYADPIRQITDKAGVRIVLLYQDHREPTEELLYNLFDVLEYEDKMERLGVDKLGYSGIHCQVQLKPDDGGPAISDFLGLNCEIQIHTCAQHAWSETTHDLSYKPPGEIPRKLERALNRLVALTELFDDEVSRVRQEVMTMAGFKEAQVLVHLERHFYGLAHSRFDKELSLQVISRLTPLYGGASAEERGATMDVFANVQRAKLEQVYRAYQSDDRTESLFVHQPESLLVFHRFEVDQFSLTDLWEQWYPRLFLEHLALAWGLSLE